MKRHFPYTVLMMLALCAAVAAAQDPASRMNRYNVVWDSPGKDATDSMPIGNGDLAANVYVADGALYLLLSKSDAFDWRGNLIKTGRVKVSLNPSPFTDSGDFRQKLDIAQSSIEIEQNGVAFRIWVDANNPVYHVELNSDREVEVRVEPEFWIRKICIDEFGRPTPGNSQESEQDTRHDRGNTLIWAHRNTKSIHPGVLEHYGIPEMAKTHRDPFLNVTVGNLIESPGLMLKDGRLTGNGKRFDIRIHGLRTTTADVNSFVADIQKLAREDQRKTDWQKHKRWWADFWDRSWVVVSDNTIPKDQREVSTPPVEPGQRSEPDGGFVVAQNYNVQRFMMACQSRGGCQAQFNGGLFTTPISYGDNTWDEDGRNWGRRFTFQNQRLPYWPLLTSGDYDLMQPFFEYYRSILPLKKAFTKIWFGHDGAYFRENTQLCGDEIGDSGLGGKPPRSRKEVEGSNKGWHWFHFNATLELSYMALRVYQHTGDAAFRDRILIPLAREGLLFYDKHFPRDAKGKIRLEPNQALETYWETVNGMPDVAGLRALLAGMIEVEGASKPDRANWQRMMAEMPEIPTEERDGKRILLPGEYYANHHNAENPELYAAFPYDVVSIVRGNHQVLVDTMPHRTRKNAFDCRCWTQDQIQFAYAGMAEQARAGLEERFRQYSTNMRFPIFGRESPDHVPDFDHNGAGSVALQKMLLNEAGGKIYLLPAWPKQWDADFKLHASGGTVVTGVVRNGKLQSWNISPESRKADVVAGSPAAE